MGIWEHMYNDDFLITLIIRIPILEMFDTIKHWQVIYACMLIIQGCQRTVWPSEDQNANVREELLEAKKGQGREAEKTKSQIEKGLCLDVAWWSQEC